MRRVTLIGDFSVGKSSIIMRLMKDEFNTAEPTVGASYFTIDIEN